MADPIELVCVKFFGFYKFGSLGFLGSLSLDSSYILLAVEQDNKGIKISLPSKNEMNMK